VAELSITAANVISSGNNSSGIAGATITAGQAVYKDSTDSNKLKLCLATGTAAQAACVGIALNGSADGQPFDYITAGSLVPGATVAAGTIYTTGSTAGGIDTSTTAASSDRLTILGVGTATNAIKVSLVLSGVQKA